MAGFLDVLRNFGLYDPQAQGQQMPNPYGLPDEMVAAARQQAMMGMGSQLLAAAAARDSRARSAALAGLAEAGDMSRPLYNMAQAKLMASPRERETRTAIADVDGRRALIDMTTGEVIRDMGPVQSEAGAANDGVFGNVYFDQNGQPVVLGKNGEFRTPGGLAEGVRLQTPEERAAATAAGKVQGNAPQVAIDYYMKTGRTNLEKNAEALGYLNQGRTLLETGIQAGSGADIIQGMRGWGRTLGINVDERILVDTQAYQNFMRNTVIPRMKDIGGNDSNEEMQKMEKLSGADITQAPEALKLTLDYTEKLLRRKMQADRDVEKKAIEYLGIAPVAEPETYTPPAAPRDRNSILKQYGVSP